MGLRRQIIAAFAVLLLPLAVVALLALSAISTLGGAVDAVRLENDLSLEAASEMETALERIDSAALLALLGREAEARGLLDAAEPRFEQALGVAAGNLTIEGEDALVAEVREHFQAVQGATQVIRVGDAEASRVAYAESFTPAFRRTKEAVGALRAANRQAVTEAGAATQASARTAFWGVVAGLVLALAVGAWAAVRLSRQIAAQHAPAA